MTYAHNINKIMQGYMDTIAEQSMEIKKLKEQAVTFTNLSDMQTELLHKMDADHVSKSELRAYIEEIIQKEVFRKTIRFPQDKIVTDTKEEMAHRILEKFCKEGEL